MPSRAGSVGVRYGGVGVRVGGGVFVGGLGSSGVLGQVSAPSVVGVPLQI